jgi:protein-disulfide isomerase
MLLRAMVRTWAVLALGLLAACGSQSIPASPAPSGAAQPTSVPAAPTAAAIAATAAVPPTSAVAPTTPAAAPTTGATQLAESAAIPDGLTPEGYHMLGRPDAPVTLVMYSDFL